MAKEDIKDEIRALALSDLEQFIRLVHPNRVLGSVHKRLIRWWYREEAKQFQLTLLPRDHQKSILSAYRVAWEITRNPAVRVLYISSTANLANKQLKFIKDILTSDIYRFYWPEMVNVDEGKREKWTETEIAVDHPVRKAELVRDPTVFAAGLTTTVTGMHCDIAVMDDVVVYENAYTEEGRNKVRSQYSLLASVEAAGAHEWIVGTRYHPKDLYSTLVEKQVEVFSDTDEITGYEPLYEKFEEAVEDRGDGRGQFLWPRQQRSDGAWFGFDERILATKRAQYLDISQFYAQYYNNPNVSEAAGITSDNFQYFDRAFLSRSNGYWYYKTNRLNVYAAVDFAYSLGNRSDYTSIVVIGIDANRNYYVLDIDRFKTDKVSEYFAHMLRLHQKWDFRKLRAETTGAQKTIVETLKLNYIKPHGLALSIEDFRPNKTMGRKEERIAAILQPLYDNRQVWHQEGGNWQTLEEELVLTHPPHDDIKDCLASVCGWEKALAPINVIPPTQTAGASREFNRFGGF